MVHLINPSYQNNPYNNIPMLHVMYNPPQGLISIISTNFFFLIRNVLKSLYQSASISHRQLNVAVTHNLKKFIHEHYDSKTTINMIFSVIYYLELRNAIFIYCISHIYQQMWNWQFEHYKRLTTLLDKKNINSKRYNTMWIHIVMTINIIFSVFKEQNL